MSRECNPTFGTPHLCTMKNPCRRRRTEAVKQLSRVHLEAVYIDLIYENMALQQTVKTLLNDLEEHI